MSIYVANLDKCPFISNIEFFLVNPGAGKQTNSKRNSNSLV